MTFFYEREVVNCDALAAQKWFLDKVRVKMISR